MCDCPFCFTYKINTKLNTEQKHPILSRSLTELFQINDICNMDLVSLALECSDVINDPKKKIPIELSSPIEAQHQMETIEKRITDVERIKKQVAKYTFTSEEKAIKLIMEYHTIITMLEIDRYKQAIRIAQGNKSRINKLKHIAKLRHRPISSEQSETCLQELSKLAH